MSNVITLLLSLYCRINTKTNKKNVNQVLKKLACKIRVRIILHNCKIIIINSIKRRCEPDLNYKQVCTHVSKKNLQ